MAQFNKVKCPKTGRISITPVREKAKVAPKKKETPKAKTEE